MRPSFEIQPTKVRARALVHVATPTYTGHVVHSYCTALVLAAQHCNQFGVFIETSFTPCFSLVEYARNLLVKKFLDTNATHLMWLDADLGFSPDAILRMVNACTDDKPVIAGVYPTKSDTESTYPYTALGPVDKNGLQPAEIVPGGFILMKRKVVEKVVEQCEEWHAIDCDGETHVCARVFDLRMRDKRLIGEDYIFCHRIRMAGFPIHVMTDINFMHYGLRPWAGNLAKQLKHEDEQNAKNGTQLGQNVEVAHMFNAAHAAQEEALIAAEDAAARDV